MSFPSTNYDPNVPYGSNITPWTSPGNQANINNINPLTGNAATYTYDTKDINGNLAPGLNDSAGTGFAPATSPLNGAIGNVYAPLSNAQLAQLYQLQGQPQVQGAINTGFNNATATAPTIGGTTINTAQTNPLMSGEVSNINALSALAQGQGPSAATVEAAQAADQQRAIAASTAAGQRGGSNPGGAAAAVERQNATTGQQAVQAATLAKVQEELAARQQLTGALGGAYGQAAGTAQAQAQIDYQTKSANLQAALTQGQINAQQYQAMLSALQNEYAQATQSNAAYGNLITNENTALQGIQKGVATSSSAQNLQLLGAGSSAGGAVLGGLLSASDIKLKDHIKVGHARVKDFLSSFNTIKYAELNELL